LEKRKTTTSSAVKNRYNQKTYARYELRLRKDSPLYMDVEKFKESNPDGLPELLRGLLEKHFSR